VDLVLLDKLTEGTACTVLAAFKFINNEVPLLIANSDQIVDMPMQDFVQDCMQKQAQGSILCFKDEERNPKWSFARINSDGYVVEVKEKVAISDLATVGIYLFSSGRSFCESAIEMIVQNERVNNEFYTCPVYNYLIKDGKHIVTYTIPETAMHGIGTPEDLNVYLQRIG
jgi:dTDP-glucose pyrophosphorylase